MSVEHIAKPRAKQAANDAPPASLWEAFALAQEQFGPLIKSKVGAHKASYAPLDGVLDMVRPILNDNALALTQPTTVEDGVLMVRTVIVHKTSKEMHECVYPAGALTLDHQKLGAGVTYARRYSLLSILGVFPENEDDDGEKAGAAGGAPRQKVMNPNTGRMVDPSSPNQQRKSGSWERFMEKLDSFTDVDELEGWWADGDTQAKVAMLPVEWRPLAADEYEKKQEALLQAGAP